MIRRCFLPVLCALFVSVIVSASAAVAPEQYDLWVLQPFGGSETCEGYVWDGNNHTTECGTATSGRECVDYAAWHNNEEGLNQAGFLQDEVKGTRGTNVPGLTGLARDQQ